MAVNLTDELIGCLIDGRQTGFLTITAPAEYRYVIGGLPMLLLGLMLLYYRFGKGGSMDDAPAPSEIKKVSKKSLKHQAKKNKVK